MSSASAPSRRPAGPGQKSRPTTAAPCRRRLAAGSRRSILAASTACTVSGISTSATAVAARHRPASKNTCPPSIRCRRISSRKNGLPSPRSRIRDANAIGQVVDREQRADQMLGLVVIERIERDRGEVPSPASPAGPPGGELRACGAQEDDAPGHALGELVEEIEERGVRPVDVLDDDDRRRRGAERGEERSPGGVDLDPDVARIHVAEPERRVLDAHGVREGGRRPGPIGGDVVGEDVVARPSRSSPGRGRAGRCRAPRPSTSGSPPGANT